MIGKIVYLENTTSTNEYIKQYIRGGGELPICVFASSQTNGKGRNNRTFISESGGLYFSAGFRIKDAEPNIMLKTSLAVMLALEEKFGIKTDIKWVNDILYKGKKLCGINAIRANDCLIIGIGINLYNKIADEIKDIAISLFENQKMNVDVIRELADLLYDYLLIMLKMKNVENEGEERIFKSFENWLSIYHLHSAILKRNVSLFSLEGNLITTGIVDGFKEDGSIIINENGEKKEFCAGEISLRVK